MGRRVYLRARRPNFVDERVTMQPPTNGTDERLDAILAELRAIRARIEAGNPQPSAEVELKEPTRKQPGRASK